MNLPGRHDPDIEVVTSSPIDVREFLRPDDTVLWGQGTGEPRTLTEALVAQRARLSGIKVFLGAASYSETVQPEHADHLQFFGLGGIGSNAALTRAGVLDVLPCNLSSLPALIEGGRLPVDVVFVQVSPAGADGRHSLGLAGDYLRSAIASARTVVAEVNDQVPRTLGACWLEPSEVDHFVHSSRPPVYLPGRDPNEVEQRIGALVAGLVPDGAVLQLGVGNTPQAIARCLTKKRDLGVHSGVVGDWIVDLTERGAVTNSLKAIDRGVTVTGALHGTRRLYDFAHENPALELHPLSYTHESTVLRRLENFVAINSALEVDLTGQVNAETLGGAYIGAVGGQVDFVRAAIGSVGGRSIIALPSAAGGGQVSRIVARLADGVTTTPRSEADVVVTEHGIANLRGLPLRERISRMIAIADPRFRDELEASIRGSRGIG